MNTLLSVGPFSGMLLILLVIIAYLLPVIFVVYWMVKMLNNSNENLKVNKEILNYLKKEK